MLAAIDASPAAPAVLAGAQAVADLYGADLEVLHVHEDSAAPVHEAAATAGLPLHELHGETVEEIADAARAGDVIAVVIGARGEDTGPRPAGHTALQVITRLNKPVAIVPPDGWPPEHIDRVLLPLEGSAESSRAVAGTVELAGQRAVDVVVLHVHAAETVPAFEDQPQYAVPAWAHEFAVRFVGATDDHVRLVERVGDAEEQLLAAARETDCDLIALGWRQDLGPGRARIVRAALAGAGVPVLLVPVD